MFCQHCGFDVGNQLESEHYCSQCGFNLESQLQNSVSVVASTTSATYKPFSFEEFLETRKRKQVDRSTKFKVTKKHREEEVKVVKV